MVKKIVRDVLFLGQKSEPATKQDFPVGQDLQDTLRANQDRCVGMAANMIGIRKRVIIVNMGFPIKRKKDACHWKASGRQPGIKI